jgi:hypothetical protein
MDVARESVAGEFFNNPDAIATDVIALVREAIQNSLDQQVDSALPVSVKIGLRSGTAALASGNSSPFFQELQPHLDAYGVKIPVAEHACDFLTYEDFNTGGLVGNPETIHDDGSKNDFMYFFRVEGKSRKTETTDRGRWGIGKYVFSMSSGVNAFFGYSCRANDSFDEGNGILFGKATMRLHSIGTVDYQPDGWWGLQESEGEIVTPITDPSMIGEFRNTWKLVREPGQTGLSIVVPFLRGGAEAWTLNDVIMAIATEFFSPILRGQLTVSVSDGESSEDIKADTIDSVLAMIPVSPARSELVLNIEALRWAIDQEPVVWAMRHSGAPLWSKVEIEETVAKASREEFLSKGQIVVRVPVDVDNKSKTGVRASFIDVIVREESNSSTVPMFVRSGIMIRQATRQSTNNARIIVLADDPAISGLLGDAEGPAHVEWSQNTEVFKGKYTYGPSWLSWVKAAPFRVLEHLRGNSSEPDNGIAAEFFPMPEKGRGGKETPPKPPKPPRPSSLKLRALIRAIAGGVSISFEKGSKPVAAVDVVLAYDVVKGSPFKKWLSGDFDLTGTSGSTKPTFSCQGGSCEVLDGQTLRAQVTDQDNFRLDVTGFDANRDVRVEAKEVGK